MIRFAPKPTRSVKDEKPKPVKRSKKIKEVERTTRDMVPGRSGGTYKTR